MFGNLSLLTLQQYWWFLISLIGALFVFITFVQGGQTLFTPSRKMKNSAICSLLLWVVNGNFPLPLLFSLAALFLRHFLSLCGQFWGRLLCVDGDFILLYRSSRFL